MDAAADALPDIQALVITWTEPWMVKENDTAKGMSITSAFALGFHPDYYNDTALVCEATRATLYYNTGSVRPYSDFGLRPAMMLASHLAPVRRMRKPPSASRVGASSVGSQRAPAKTKSTMAIGR